MPCFDVVQSDLDGLTGLGDGGARVGGKGLGSGGELYLSGDCLKKKPEEKDEYTYAEQPEDEDEESKKKKGRRRALADEEEPESESCPQIKRRPAWGNPRLSHRNPR